MYVHPKIPTLDIYMYLYIHISIDAYMNECTQEDMYILIYFLIHIAYIHAKIHVYMLYGCIH